MQNFRIIAEINIPSSDLKKVQCLNCFGGSSSSLSCLVTKIAKQIPLNNLIGILQSQYCSATGAEKAGCVSQIEIIPNGVFRSAIFLVLGAGVLNSSLALGFGVLLVDGDPKDFPSNNLWVNGIGISTDSSTFNALPASRAFLRSSSSLSSASLSG